MHAAQLNHSKTNDILAGMDAAMIEHLKHIKEIAPRSHFTPTHVDGWSDKRWWVCRHCGHSKNE